ncbi:MAG: prephenate dehydrogenase/arogenate dehydrogenase family protein [Calditrichia bacterium]
MITVGLIGFGRFGEVLFRHLGNRHTFKIYDPSKSENPNFRQIPFASLGDVCRCSLVIIAVPVSALKKVISEAAPLLPAGTIVMDVCAVKSYPLQIMEDQLPEDVHLLGTHPLFGPDSASRSLKGHRIIFTPLRIPAEQLEVARNFWSEPGVRIMEMSAVEHDRLMAWTLAMTHFLGRALHTLPLPQTNIATKDYQNLLRLVRKINRDTDELFEDMHRYNPFTREMRKMLVESMQDMKMHLDRNDEDREQ